MKKKLLFIIGSGLFITFVFLGSLYIFSFRLNGKNKIELPVGMEYKELGYKANIFSLSFENLVKVNGKVDSNKLGKYIITYELPFKKLLREVLVVDKEKPNIELDGDKEIVLSIGSDYQEKGYKANDNYDGELTDKVEISNNIDKNKIGEYKVNYLVKDSSNNKTEVERIVKVIDNIPPVISLKGSRNITVKVNGNYEEDGYTASDNLDGDITNKVKVSRNVNFSKVGTYSIIYEVEDSSNNKTTISRTINVIENVEITYIKGILLVNKKYHLPANYNPGVNREAYQALQRLQADGRVAGHGLPLLSGFRSYNDQKYLFNSYVAKDGEALASTYSARPGQSEHQTGLAFDVGQISDNFGNTAAGIWLKENCHKYGFIIRYLKGKESITGYKYEPWHIRYVGENVATEIYNQGVTLEEYLGVA